MRYQRERQSKKDNLRKANTLNISQKMYIKCYYIHLCKEFKFLFVLICFVFLLQFLSVPLSSAVLQQKTWGSPPFLPDPIYNQSQILPSFLSPAHPLIPAFNTYRYSLGPQHQCRAGKQVSQLKTSTTPSLFQVQPPLSYPQHCNRTPAGTFLLPGDNSH